MIAPPLDELPAMQHTLDLRPELSELFTGYYAQLWSDALVDPVLLELCRLRIAQLLGDGEQQMVRYHSALEAGLDEAKIAELSRYVSSARFTEHERTCLDYAEHYVIDVHSISDADADRVKQHMTDAEFVAFTVALGMLEGVARFRLALGLSGEVPAQPVVVASPSPGRPLP